MLFLEKWFGRISFLLFASILTIGSLVRAEVFLVELKGPITPQLLTYLSQNQLTIADLEAFTQFMQDKLKDPSLTSEQALSLLNNTYIRDYKRHMQMAGPRHGDENPC